MLRYAYITEVCTSLCSQCYHVVIECGMGQACLRQRGRHLLRMRLTLTAGATQCRWAIGYFMLQMRLFPAACITARPFMGSSFRPFPFHSSFPLLGA